MSSISSPPPIVRAGSDEGLAYPIPARLICDDGVTTADFDATAWFEEAGDAIVLELARSNFDEHGLAIEVASSMACVNRDVSGFMDHCRLLERTAANAGGFVCCIDRGAARLWLATNREQLYRQAYLPQERPR